MRRIAALSRASVPLQIVVGAALGLIVGSFLSPEAADPLGRAGKMIIHWVKLIAGPFLFFTIVHSVLGVEIAWRQGAKLLGIALLNTTIAIIIGITLAWIFLRGHSIEIAPPPGVEAPTSTGITLDFGNWIQTFMPASLFEPFVKNEILLIALLALILSLGIRRSGAFDSAGLTRLAGAVDRARNVMSTLLGWLIRLIPFAVFAVLTATVAQNGFGVFGPLARFLAVVTLGLTLQAALVYGGWIFLIAGFRPRDIWRVAREPLLYAWGTNSSLATLPLTLKALRSLGVSDRSASLGAGVATNLNNDGIVLYEAMAVFFVAFASGIPFEPMQMAVAALACMVASMGITGIPEAGFISLTVVIGTLGLPTELLPLLLAVDWVVGRFRSMVNVLSDMTLSIALDAVDSPRRTPSSPIS